METENELVVAHGQEGEKDRLSIANGYRASFWVDENILSLEHGDGWTTLYAHPFIYPKYVNFMVFKFKQI